VNVKELAINGVYIFTPQIYRDPRGFFIENFVQDKFFDQLNIRFPVEQINTSVSAKGVIRGIHFADVPPGQAKFVSVMNGKIQDFVVDLRVGSPSFGSSLSVLLDSETRQSLYLPEGIGHGFLSLYEDTVVSYLVSTKYNPMIERSINPLDKDIKLDFEYPIQDLIISERDSSAMSFKQALSEGLLPDYSSCFKEFVKPEISESK
jgi:dTDP-4-dehydrorhamnose 3,5-epimerase